MSYVAYKITEDVLKNPFDIIVTQNVTRAKSLTSWSLCYTVLLCPPQESRFQIHDIRKPLESESWTCVNAWYNTFNMLNSTLGISKVADELFVEQLLSTTCENT